MLKAIRKKLDKKGFTLVELIVVLVILAILAALLIPALTGYIDRSREEAIKAETRMIAMAVQTEAVTAYGADTNAFATNADKIEVDKVVDLAEVKALTKADSGAHFAAVINKNGSIKTVNYYDGANLCEYDAENQVYKVTMAKGNPTAITANQVKVVGQT